eukprot:scaffold56810_cov48-Phaeocystis_antarctica.AAC.1
MAEEEGVPAPATDPVNTLVVQDGAPKPAGGEAPKEGSLEETLDLDSAALFSTRRPKDVSAGMASGAKTIMKGVVAGAIGLVAAPVMGAREEGVKGFVKGVGMGVAGAIALPVAGTILGCVQVTRGALNTPDAIKQRKAGKVWDEDTRQWVVYNLREEARELLSRRATLTLALTLTLTLTLARAITLTLALTLPLARRASCSRRARWSGASSMASLAAAESSGVRRRRGGARSRRRSCTTCSASRPRPRAPISRRPTTSGRGSCTLTRTAATLRHTPTSRRLPLALTPALPLPLTLTLTSTLTLTLTLTRGPLHRAGGGRGLPGPEQRGAAGQVRQGGEEGARGACTGRHAALEP